MPTDVTSNLRRAGFAAEHHAGGRVTRATIEIVATDWTTLGAAAISSGAVLAASAVGVMASGRRDEREREQTNNSARRMAFMELFVCVDQVLASVRGALGLGRTVDLATSDHTRAFLAAQVVAEFHASSESWTEVERLIQACALWSNRLSHEHRGTGTAETRHEIATRLNELGPDNEDGLHRLSDLALNAARRDVGLVRWPI